MPESQSSDAPDAIREHYDSQGYYVFRNVLSQGTIKALHKHMESKVYPCDTPLLRHPSITLDHHAYQTDANGERFVSNSLYNPHLEDRTAELGQLLLDLICTEKVANILERLDGDHEHTLHQIILFFVQANTGPHIDGWAIDTDPPGNFYTLWAPLQPITLENGPVGIFPWRRGNLLSPEALGIADFNAIPVEQAQDAYHEALCAHLDKSATGVVVPLPGPGDLIVFSSTTPHATMPPRREAMIRRALQIMVRPASARWGGSFVSRLNGGIGDGDDPRDIRFNERWKLSMTQRRDPQ